MKPPLKSKAARSPRKTARKERIATIGGVRVKLMPVSGRGNLPVSLIKQIIREIKADRAALKE